METARTIAIVDDDPDTRLLAAAVLARAGYRTLEDDGSRGVALRLAAHAPDVILLDLHLDGRTGVDALREIRSLNALAETPIFAFSGAREKDPLLHRIADHVVGQIRKPIDAVELQTVLARFFPPTAPVEHAPAIDLDAVRRRFLDGLPGRARRIAYARDQGDAESMLFEVHRLRGAAGGYQLSELADAAAAAESALRSAQPGSTIDHLLEVIQHTIAENPPG